jgi:hypothetical protein
MWVWTLSDQSRLDSSAKAISFANDEIVCQVDRLDRLDQVDRLEARQASEPVSALH